LEYRRRVKHRRWADILRATTIVAMCVAAAASGGGARQQEAQPQYGAAPPPQQMDPVRALGLWKSSFGAVKIEEDTSRGQGTGLVQGVWVYQRAGQDVVGVFGGSLRGNVLEFSWQEPSTPVPLVGQGYLVFDPTGQRFAGRWWTTARDRTGEWSGWRQDAGTNGGTPDDGGTNPYGGGYGGQYGNDPYGGATYGYGYPPPPPSQGY
jgi:hypothetical protein